MKIIRIPLLENKNSINSIEISYDNLFLAFEGPENAIWVFLYSDFKKVLEYVSPKKSQIIDKEEEEKNQETEPITKLRRQYWFNDSLNLKKILLKEHTNSISSLLFLHTDSHVLFSSGFDKYIIIWRLDESKMTGERVRKIPCKQEITDMKLYPDDKLLFVGYINGEINIFSCDYANNQFHSIAIFAQHDDYLNSIVLSPNIMEDGLFVSLSDKGKLILSQIFMKNTGGIDVKIKKIFPFENIHHFSKGDTKKIDWSPDGSMIISVDHKYIQSKPIIHARLIFLDDLDNSNPLIGHVASPLIAKFSKCEYYYNNEMFFLLATCDKASNIKIWKVNTKTRKCSLLFTNDDFSDSIIRDIIFSNDGKYLFFVSSFGSISIIVFDDLKILNKEYLGNNNLINGNINMNTGISRIKKKVVPQIFSPNQPIIKNNTTAEVNLNFDGIYLDNESYNSNIIKSNNRNNNIPQQEIITRDLSQILNMNMLKNNLYQSLDSTQMHFFNSISEQINRLPTVNKKIFKFDKIKTVEGYYLILAYENNIPYNTSIISLRLSNNYIIYMKQTNGFIKLFTYSNICYAFYDSKSTLNIYSILGTPYYMNNYIADVTKMDLFNNYILLITNDNQIIILDFINKKNIFTSKLLCLSLNNASIMEKINNLYFLGLNNIIFDIVQSSLYSNVTNRKIIYYNCLNNEFTLSPDDCLTQTDKYKINERENLESPYSALMKQIYFDYNTKYSEDNYIAIDRQITACFENLKNDNNKNILVASLKNFANMFKNFVFIIQDFDFINKKYNF